MSTTAPTAVWNPTLLTSIKGALLTVGAIQEGEDLTAEDYAVCVEKVQNWIKEQEASGLHVWTECEGILFLQANQYRYLLGPGTADHACDAFNYVQTTSTASIGADGTVIPFTSVAGISSGDNIGVVLDSGTTFCPVIYTGSAWIAG